MGRSALLPLPDDQARLISVRAPDLHAAHTSGGNRPFLRDFIRLVHEATGSIFGAKTIYTLLGQFVPSRRPSITTIASELSRYREQVAGLQAPASAAPPAQSAMAQYRPAVAAPSQLEEIIRFLHIEAAQLRERAASADRRASDALQKRDEALRQLAACEGELLGTKQSRDNLHDTVEKLAQALQVATDRAAAENRQNMLRVDQARKEGREEAERLREQVRNAQAQISALERENQQANVTIHSLRQALSAARHGQERST